jgi:hypothetical protein
MLSVERLRGCAILRRLKRIAGAVWSSSVAMVVVVGRC